MVMINTPLQVQNSSERIAFGLTIIKMVSFFCGLERSNKEYKEYKTNALNVQISDKYYRLVLLELLITPCTPKKNLKPEKFRNCLESNTMSNRGAYSTKGEDALG